MMRRSDNWENRLRENIYLIASLIFSLFQLILIIMLYGVRLAPDSPSYIETVNYFLGKSSVKPHRLLTPLGPLIAIVFQPLVGEINAFGIENSIFFVSSSILIYLFCKKLYDDKEVAFFTSVFFSSSISVITWGIAVLTDMGVWFFYILSIFLTLRFFEEEKIEILLTNGVICGLGFLMKENVVAGVFFFILMMAFSKRELIQKTKTIILFCAMFLLPIVAVQVITFQLFQYTYLDWYIYNIGLYSETYFTFLRFLIGLILAFTLMLPFFLFGIYREIKENDQSPIPRLYKYLFLTLSSAVPIFAWALLIERFIFLLFPTIIPISAYGLIEFQRTLSERTMNGLAKGIIILILCIYVTFNNIFLYFRPEIITIFKVIP